MELDFLKEAFGDKPLTFDEFVKAVKGSKDIELVNAAGGSYVSKEKYDAQKQKYESVKNELSEANKQIENFKGMDIEGIKKAADEWKAKAENAEKERAELEYSCIVKDAAAGLKFTSESAKKAFINELKAKGLAIENGKLLGVDDFVKSYRENDPRAFEADAAVPRFSSPIGGGERKNEFKSYSEEVKYMNQFN